MAAPRVLAFDGDDTLWHNETLFASTQERFRELLVRHAPEADVDERLLAVETRNLRLFGYGIKGFVLSMIETAVELTDGRVTGREVQGLIDLGKAMLEHPTELLDGVAEVLERLAPGFELMLITKGDLFDQEAKLARSGLGDRFARIEIVSEKDPATYRRLLGRHGIAPGEFLMVGNTMRSDVLPVAAIGGRAVHVPYVVTWAHEAAAGAALPEGAWRLKTMAELPGLLTALAR